MSAWAACLLSGRLADLGPLRLCPQIEFAEVVGAYWVRGPQLDDNVEHELKKIPGLLRFELLPAQSLRPVGSRIPDRALPPANWRPVKQALAVALPVAALAGEAMQKLPLVVVRAGQEQPAAALMLELDQWHDYAVKAPFVRLAPLRFAAAEQREVLVFGAPLPSVPGRRFAAHGSILVPCGFTWSPAVEPVVLQQLFELRHGDIAVLTEDNTHQVIRSEQFVPASRSAARATVEESPHV